MGEIYTQDFKRKSDRNKLLQTSTHKWEFNTTQTEYEDVNWVHLGQYRDQ